MTRKSNRDDPSHGLELLEHYTSRTMLTSQSGTTAGSTEIKLTLANSEVYLQNGPAGVVARVEWPDEFSHEYAGPLSPGTLAALTEVAR